VYAASSPGVAFARSAAAASAISCSPFVRSSSLEGYLCRSNAGDGEPAQSPDSYLNEMSSRTR
jgi:hypothetical protein